MSQWIRSEKGRAALGYTAVILACGIGYAQTLRHTFFLSKYREFMQMYRSGIEIPVPPKVTELTNKVLVDCKLNEKDIDYLKFFTVFGFDMFSAGSTKLSNGAVIGVPYNFCYEDTSDVDLSLLKVDANPDEGELDYQSGTGKKLISSVIFSEKARQFAIAREVYSCTTYRYLIGGLSTTFTLLSGYLLGVNLNHKFNFSKLPILLRMAAFTVCGTVGLVSCFMINDAVNIYYDGNADKLAANLGKEYAVGGVEFYEKQMMKNKCLRRLMGQKGEKFYTASGNLEAMIRTKSLPLSARLDSLKDILEKYDEDKK